MIVISEEIARILLDRFARDMACAANRGDNIAAGAACARWEFVNDMLTLQPGDILKKQYWTGKSDYAIPET
jgi:hypothetical protein